MASSRQIRKESVELASIKAAPNPRIHQQNPATMESIRADLRFQTPCGIHVVGPTMSGKSTLTRKLINESNLHFSTRFSRIVYAYNIQEDSFDNIRGGVEFIQGLDTIFDYDHFFRPDDKTLSVVNCTAIQTDCGRFSSGLTVFPEIGRAAGVPGEANASARAAT